MSVYADKPCVLERVTLSDLVGETDADAVSDLAYAVLDHRYREDLLQATLLAALAKHKSANGDRFLSLNHLRHAHGIIEEVREIMYDTDRLDFLSDVAGCRVEPYPIPTAGSHVNFYEVGARTIDYHTDGCAMVELIPLSISGHPPDSGTILSRDPVRRDLSRSRQGSSDTDDGSMIRVPHALGRSVLLQGRSLLHSADVLNGGSRVTLVLPLRSVDEPWKDDNTLFRLLQDDSPDDVVEHWVRDVVDRQVPAYAAFEATCRAGATKVAP